MFGRGWRSPAAPTAKVKAGIDSLDDDKVADDLAARGMDSLLQFYFEKNNIPPRGNFRRLATRTIKAQGIDYLLIGGDYVAASDIGADPRIGIIGPHPAEVARAAVQRVQRTLFFNQQTE